MFRNFYPAVGGKSKCIFGESRVVWLVVEGKQTLSKQ